MRAEEIIRKKRDGGELSPEEIRWFIEGTATGDIPDYQITAFLMAVWFRGMTPAETAELTFAIRDSGEILRLPDLGGLRVDKHSTGGVGDKTSLVIAPIVSALGVKVAKMSGRGLGHTGGTIDKLESFAGFRTDLSRDEFVEAVKDVGIAIVGQSATLAPADKKLYALRDVTATVDSLPLIVSSIMGKKLAADDDCILLDVKCGSGSFMKTSEKSRELARAMVDIGKRSGKKTVALITDMDRPLGYAVGNSLEVIEAIETLRGEGPADLTDICLTLASEMLAMTGRGSVEECREAALGAIRDGSALAKLAAMVKRQGGDPAWVYDTSLFPKAKYSKTVLAGSSGYVVSTDTEGYGRSALILGAGRAEASDPVDNAAGIILKAKTGDKISAGDPIADLYTNNEASLDEAEAVLTGSTRIGPRSPRAVPLILGRIE